MGFSCVSGGSECNGCMCCQSTPRFLCPECEEEIFETVYVNANGDIVGCENCIEARDPYEVFDDEA